jgi:hypothetical protein
LTTDVPGVTIKKGDVCSICDEYDRLWGNWKAQLPKKRIELEKIFHKAKTKERSYDVLVPISGGKDSTYALYVCRKEYDLNCLAVTFDNGFLTEHAKQNIKRACHILGVDHYFFKPDRKLLMMLYRHFFLKTGFFCPACTRGMGVGNFRTQIGFRIPLMVRGSAGRTEEYVSNAFFLTGTHSLIENVLHEAVDTDLIRKAAFLLHSPGLFRSPPTIKLPDYMDWDYKKIFETITRELGWSSLRTEEEHTDCAVHDVVDYIRYKKFPALIPEMLRFSKLVTAGLMTRQEAELKIMQSQPVSEPETLEMFLRDLHITKEEFEKTISDPMRHFLYLKERNPILRRLSSLKSELFLDGL